MNKVTCLLIQWVKFVEWRTILNILNQANYTQDITKTWRRLIDDGGTRKTALNFLTCMNAHRCRSIFVSSWRQFFISMSSKSIFLASGFTPYSGNSWCVCSDKNSLLALCDLLALLDRNAPSVLVFQTIHLTTILLVTLHLATLPLNVHVRQYIYMWFWWRACTYNDMTIIILQAFTNTLNAKQCSFQLVTHRLPLDFPAD